MDKKEYREVLRYELYGNKNLYRNTNPSFLQRLRIKYFQPNTNCIYLARKMWWLFGRGGVHKYRAKLIYLRILHRYGCIIFPTAKVGRGFHITHPVGIVIGNCEVGQNFMIYQNCTIGLKVAGEGYPTIGNNVELCANSLILGNVNVCDNCMIGAASLVVNSLSEAGIYVGTPAKKVEKSKM